MLQKPLTFVKSISKDYAISFRVPSSRESKGNPVKVAGVKRSASGYATEIPARAGNRGEHGAVKDEFSQDKGSPNDAVVYPSNKDCQTASVSAAGRAYLPLINNEKLSIRLHQVSCNKSNPTYQNDKCDNLTRFELSSLPGSW